MAISGIASPVAGTVITTAFVDLNYKTPLLYLVALLGGFGGQPGAANRVPVSNGTESGAWGQVPTDAIADLAVTTGKIAAGAITAAKIGTDAVTAVAIQAGAVGTDELGTGVVTFAKLADANVTEQKLLDGAVTAAKLAANAVTQVKVADAAIGTAELIDANVTAAKMAENAIAQANMQDASVGTSELIDLNVTTGKLANLAVTAAKIDNATITEAKVQPNTLTNQSMASGMAAANLGYTPARIAAGSYVGNGASTQFINLGWTPATVFIHNPATGVGIYHNSGDRTTLGYSGNIVAAGTGGIVSDGFNAILGANNATSTTYFYVAIG